MHYCSFSIGLCICKEGVQIAFRYYLGQWISTGGLGPKSGSQSSFKWVVSIRQEPYYYYLLGKYNTS